MDLVQAMMAVSGCGPPVELPQACPCMQPLPGMGSHAPLPALTPECAARVGDIIGIDGAAGIKGELAAGRHIAAGAAAGRGRAGSGAGRHQSSMHGMGQLVALVVPQAVQCCMQVKLLR